MVVQSNKETLSPLLPKAILLVKMLQVLVKVQWADGKNLHVINNHVVQMHLRHLCGYLKMQNCT